MNSKRTNLSGYSSVEGTLCSGIEVREKEIPLSVNELDKSISILQEELSILYGKLNPIMQLEPSKEENCLNESIADKCELGGQIRSSVKRIASITRDVRIVLDMLEI